MSLIVAEAVERIRNPAEQHGVKIIFDEPETNQVVFGDRRQLISALHALLENAVVYSPSDGTVEIAIRRVEASDADTPEGQVAGVQIEIRDYGVGIPAKDLERIFERFYRVDPGRARETGGTGLGLGIVRHVAITTAAPCSSTHTRVRDRPSRWSYPLLRNPYNPAMIASRFSSSRTRRPSSTRSL